MFKKSLFDHLKNYYVKFSSLNPITKSIILMAFACVVISTFYYVRSLTTKSQIAEIVEIPATPPITPPLTSPTLNWQTSSVSLQADRIEITTNTQGSGFADSVFLANPNNITNFNLHSDRATNNGNHTTLEATWNENNVEMRLFLYFEAYEQDFQRKWRLTKVDTYNGRSPGDWVNSYSGGVELFNPTNIGSSLNISYAEMSTSGGGYFHVKFTNLRLQAFLEETTHQVICTRTPPSISLSPQNQSVLPLQTTTYSANITNNDSQSCGSSIFTFGTMTSSPFTLTSNLDSLAIGAGSTGSITLTATTPPSNPWGEQRSIPVTLTAHNSSSSLFGSANSSLTLLLPQPQTFDFIFKLDGVTGSDADGAKVNLKFYLKDGTIRTLPTPLTLSHSSGNLYKTSLTIANPLPPGTEFRIKAKGEKHVAVEFCKAIGQTQPCQDNEYLSIPNNLQSAYLLNFSTLALPAGDLPPQDGKVAGSDLAVMKTLMGKSQSSLSTADLAIGDLNYDGHINIYDVFLILKTMDTRYDE